MFFSPNESILFWRGIFPFWKWNTQIVMQNLWKAATREAEDSPAVLAKECPPLPLRCE